MSLVSTKLAFTLPVSSASLERVLSELDGITATSLTIERALSIPVSARSTAARLASVGTSPVTSTSRL